MNKHLIKKLIIAVGVAVAIAIGMLSCKSRSNDAETTHIDILQRTDRLIPMITDFLDSDLNARPLRFKKGI